MQGLQDIEDQDQPASPTETTPAPEEPTVDSEGAAETVTLPASIGGTALQAGQTVTLQIVSVDETGAQATIVTEGEGGDYEEAGPAIDRMAETKG